MATGTFPTATMSSTTLATSIPLIWGERINNFFKLKLILAEFFTDRSSELADGGSALYTPNITEMAAAAKTNATAVTLFQTIRGLIIQLKQSIMNVYETKIHSSNTLSFVQ